MSPKSRRVLVVEDQQLWREQFFGDTLTELGHNVSLASTKEEALAYLVEGRFDLVIVDINLTDVPGNQDGLAITDYIYQSGARTPVIVVSGAEAGMGALHERPYQVFARIHKDLFNLDEFIAQVNQALVGTNH